MINYSIEFNEGIGAFPVSLFLEVGDKIKNIFDIWDRVQEMNCRDVIFYGNIEGNIHEINFINSRLISNGFHTSVICKSKLMEKLVASRIIVLFTADVKNVTFFKNKINEFKNLSENDILIIEPMRMKECLFVRQYLINNNIKAKVMINLKNDITKEKLLENGVYDLYIYDGEIYV